MSQGFMSDPAQNESHTDTLTSIPQRSFVRIRCFSKFIDSSTSSPILLFCMFAPGKSVPTSLGWYPVPDRGKCMLKIHPASYDRSPYSWLEEFHDMKLALFLSSVDVVSVPLLRNDYTALRQTNSTWLLLIVRDDVQKWLACLLGFAERSRWSRNRLYDTRMVMFWVLVCRVNHSPHR